MKIVITIDTNENEVKVVTDEQPEVDITGEGLHEEETSVSKYARRFDESTSKHYSSCYDVEEFLKAMDRAANELLRERGHLYLNDVYELLGLSQSEEFKNVGWIFNLENPVGDNYVDFGIYEYRNWKALRGIEGYNIVLDFNVDGDIKDLI